MNTWTKTERIYNGGRVYTMETTLYKYEIKRSGIGGLWMKTMTPKLSIGIPITMMYDTLKNAKETNK